MGAKRQQGRANLTTGHVTRLAAGGGTQLTATGNRDLTPKAVTKRRYKPRARKCACGCGKTFTPTLQAPHKRYFDDTCRQRDNRRKAARKAKSVPAEPMLINATCAYCGNGFFAEEGSGAKYCKPSHRVMASQKRKAATIRAVSEDMGTDEIDVRNALMLKGGLRRAKRYLRQQGYVYDEALRRWLVPAGGVLVDVGQG